MDPIKMLEELRRDWNVQIDATSVTLIHRGDGRIFGYLIRPTEGLAGAIARAWAGG